MVYCEVYRYEEMKFMENEWIYGFATTIQERIYVLKKFCANLDTSDALHKWRIRKSLLTDEDFHSMLQHLNITEQDYGLGVMELKEEHLKLLYSYVIKQKWFIRHKNILKEDIPFVNEGFATALRFHASYACDKIISFIKNLECLEISSEVVCEIREGIVEELLPIAERTFVWDAYEIKTRSEQTNAEENLKMSQYLSMRFGDLNKAKLFFLEYPTLARILSDRTDYYIKNFILFFSAIVESKKELEATFTISFPYKITEIKYSSGDSHNNGKRPIFFRINGQKLIFKFHSDENMISYNALLKYISTLKSDFNFFYIRCISHKKYCFEEFVDHSPCYLMEEIETYYKNYGYLVAILHFIGSNDIHMENLIAHKKYPVLIDAETIFSPKERRVYSGKYTKEKLAEEDSVILSGLLPMKKYWKRQIDVSALNGTVQKLPYKIRKLKNESDSEIMYKLEEALVYPSNNVPLFKDKEILFDDYAEIIEESYASMLNVLKKHWKNLFILCKKLFIKNSVRVLLRDTQDYYNFISFSTHPSCMVNYIEREKIFENLWSHSFLNSEVVILENESLIHHDIPYFFIELESTSLFTHNKRIDDFYTTNLIDVLYKHMTMFNYKRMLISRLLMRESLNLLEYKCNQYALQKNNESVFAYLNNLVDYILKIMVLDQNKKLALWPTVYKDAMTGNCITFSDSNIYNGSGGVYLFLSLYNCLWPQKRISNALKLLENEVFAEMSNSPYHSAYWGCGVKLLVSFTLYRFTHNSGYLDIINEGLNSLYTNLNKINSCEWLYGSSSLIVLLSDIYKELSITKPLEILEEIVKSFTIPSIDNVGFAHGYSGMLYAMLKAQEILHDNVSKVNIEILYNQIWKRLPFNTLNHSWCNGEIGVYYVLNLYYKYLGDNLKKRYQKNLNKDLCLCHGKCGYYDTLVEDDKPGHLSQNSYWMYIKDIIKDPIFLKGDRVMAPIEMFTGLSGIGYTLLQMLYPSKVLSVLYF